MNFRFSRSLFTNWGGLNERWILAENGLHYITPNGELFRWNNSPRDNLSGTKVADLTADYHQSPELLYNARDPFTVNVLVTLGQTVEGINFGNQKFEGPVPPGVPGEGNVTAVISRGNIVLTGDAAGNSVVIYTNSDGWVTVAVVGQTTIQGSATPWVLEGWTSVTADLVVNMNGGDDIVILRDVHVGADVLVDSHAGNDVLLTTSATIAGNLEFKSASGSNSLGMSSTTVGGNLKYTGGTGFDALYTNGLMVAGRTAITGNKGAELFAVENSSFLGTVTVNLGDGSDQLAVLAGNSFSDRVTVDGGSNVDYVQTDSSTTFARTPTIRRVEHSTIPDMEGLLDSIMSRFASVGLDGLL